MWDAGEHRALADGDGEQHRVADYPVASIEDDLQTVVGGIGGISAEGELDEVGDAGVVIRLKRHGAGHIQRVLAGVPADMDDGAGFFLAGWRAGDHLSGLAGVTWSSRIRIKARASSRLLARISSSSWL